MRTGLVLILLTVAAFAQDSSVVTAAQAACGPKNVNFDVKDDTSQHTADQPAAGKALVYVIQDIGAVNCIGGCVTTKIALDSAWVGANHHNSYFSFEGTQASTISAPTGSRISREYPGWSGWRTSLPRWVKFITSEPGRWARRVLRLFSILSRSIVTKADSSSPRSR